MTGDPVPKMPAEAGGVSNIIDWALAEIQCNHPHDWTEAVIDEVGVRLTLAADYMTTIESSLHRMAELVEGTYAHDAAGNRLDGDEPNMSGADCFAAVAELESVVFNALRLAASEIDNVEQPQTPANETVHPCGPDALFVLLIGHDHGVHTFVCASQEVARWRLAEYVASEWPEGVTRPATPDSAIARYFDELYVGCQWYEIQQTRLLTSAQ